jgi:hypothetical protein
MAPDTLVVGESGRELTFSFAEMIAFHGGHSPAGVAHAFKVLERSLPLLKPGGLVERRSVVIDTAFGGPGARDGFECVTRAVSDGRYTVDLALERPDLGPNRARFAFRLRYGLGSVSLTLRDGFVPDEFVTLTSKTAEERTEHEENLLTALKAEMCAQLMATPAAGVYDVA